MTYVSTVHQGPCNYLVATLSNCLSLLGSKTSLDFNYVKPYLDLLIQTSTINFRTRGFDDLALRLRVGLV